MNTFMLPVEIVWVLFNNDLGFLPFWYTMFSWITITHIRDMVRS